jgi:hypothetical protein
MVNASEPVYQVRVVLQGTCVDQELGCQRKRGALQLRPTDSAWHAIDGASRREITVAEIVDAAGPNSRPDGRERGRARTRPHNEQTICEFHEESLVPM